jgi:hypothetical protein
VVCDNNGNLTHDGANAHTWDRANRLVSMGGQYDISARYLNPGLRAFTRLDPLVSMMKCVL